MKEELRGRHLPPKEEDIIRLASTLLSEGQINPVEGHRNGDNHIVITAGFTRTCAGRLICDGFTDIYGEHQQDENFRLQVKLVNCNDADAFRRNVVENAQRCQTSPMDDAINQERLRRSYGMTDSDIMRLYGLNNTNRIARLKRFLELPPVLQDRLHNDTLTETNAILILDLPEDQREAAVTAAIQEDGKVDTNKVKSQVRDHHLRDEDDSHVPTDSKKKKNINRSMAETRKYLKAWVEGDAPEELKQFFKTFLDWTYGKRSDKKLDAAVDNVYAVMKTKKAA
jgi:ParB-like chromosome segregation protein Spo0J